MLESGKDTSLHRPDDRGNVHNINIFIANKIHDVKRGGGSPALSVTMTLFLK